MTKYEPLTGHLSSLEKENVPMTFAEIEKVIGNELPPSAFKHRPWWSNNPSNSVITYSWLRARYKTVHVDMKGRKLVFRKAPPDELPADVVTAAREGLSDNDESRTGDGDNGGLFSRIFGALKDTVTVASGTDLTMPTNEKWNVAE